MSSRAQPATEWKLRRRSIALGTRTLVMGVVNITPDSFSDGGRFLAPDAATTHGLSLLDEGADMLDLGAESTRPGSRAGGATPAVSCEEEQARLLPVLEGILTSRPEAIVSVDTYKAATARAALAAGAEIINDVSGFTWDPEMPSNCAALGCGVILMHTRGRPEEWRTQPMLDSDGLLASVRAGLEASLTVARMAGVSDQSIVLDPGYGFGKRCEENFSLLARQEELLSLGRPLLAAVSRKSFLGRTLAALNHGLNLLPIDRDTASLAAMVATILHGASIVRVHAVRPAVEAARIADAVRAARLTDSAP